MSSAYANTDINSLCQRGSSLNREEYDLTGDRPDGIHLDNTFDTQEIFAQDKFLGVCHYYLNNQYVSMNDQLEALNNARCLIYKPLPMRPDTSWYEDELMLEKEGY